MTQTQPSFSYDEAEALSALLKRLTASEVKLEPTPLGKNDVTAEFCDAPKETVDALLLQLKVAEGMAAAAKEKVDAAKQAVIDLMAGAEVLRIAETQQEVVTHRVVHATTVEIGKLRLEYPEIAMKFQKERTSRPFKVVAK